MVLDQKARRRNAARTASSPHRAVRRKRDPAVVEAARSESAPRQRGHHLSGNQTAPSLLERRMPHPNQGKMPHPNQGKMQHPNPKRLVARTGQRCLDGLRRSSSACRQGRRRRAHSCQARRRQDYRAAQGGSEGHRLRRPTGRLLRGDLRLGASKKRIGIGALPAMRLLVRH